MNNISEIFCKGFSVSCLFFIYPLLCRQDVIQHYFQFANLIKQVKTPKFQKYEVIQRLSEHNFPDDTSVIYRKINQQKAFYQSNVKNILRQTNQPEILTMLTKFKS